MVEDKGRVGGDCTKAGNDEDDDALEVFVGREGEDVDDGLRREGKWTTSANACSCTALWLSIGPDRPFSSLDEDGRTESMLNARIASRSEGRFFEAH